MHLSRGTSPARHRIEDAFRQVAGPGPELRPARLDDPEGPHGPSRATESAAAGAASQATEPADGDGLVRRARDGDVGAWVELIDRYSGLLWSVARSYRLGTQDGADVVCTCWFRLAANLGRIRDGAAVGDWLATTARRECLRAIRARRHLGDLEEEVGRWPANHPTPKNGGADLDCDQRLLAAWRRLPERDQRLLRILATSPPPGDGEVASALDMPIDDIGPTRTRSLARLRRELSRQTTRPTGTGTGAGTS